ncbi:MAG: nirK [Ignavibacteria bacterium]|nr:nirK [Ignavibacteria bacterium]
MQNRITKSNIYKFFGSLFLLFLFCCYTASSQNYDKNRAETLYRYQCSKCHRNTGKGIKYVYPPLKNSDYIRKETTVELLRGMIYGRSGVIVVNGESYNGVMTTEIDLALSDNDIALILTYVLNEMNGISKVVEAREVQTAKKAGKLPVKK